MKYRTVTAADLKLRKQRKAPRKRKSLSTQITPRLDYARRALAMKLTLVARQLWLTFDHRVETHGGRGLTRAKWSVIAAVARTPGATQRKIATLLRVTEVTAGRLIDRLCADGYLDRRENPEDRRSYLLYLAPEAKPVLDRLGELAILSSRQSMSGLAEEDLAALDGFLEKILKNIGQSRSRRGW